MAIKKTVRHADEFLSVTNLLSDKQVMHLKKLSNYLYDALKDDFSH